MAAANDPAGQWVDVPQYSPPVMASPARPGGSAGLAIADLASNGTVIAIGLLLLGAIAAIIFLREIKDSCNCKGK